MPDDKKHIHSEKWHRCWTKVQAKGWERGSAAAICTSSIGYAGSINKGHRSRKMDDDLTVQELEALYDICDSEGVDTEAELDAAFELVNEESDDAPD